MSTLEIVQVLLYIGLLIAVTPLLGGYMKRVFEGERTLLSPVLRPVEGLLYRLSGVRPEEEQPWKQYTVALILFNVLGFLALFLLQLLQGMLPLNPENLAGVEPWLAFNTATSFMTNTNWQAYAGETTMSQLTQMLGLGAQNFLSAATGIAVVLALTRGLARKSAATLGNFWADLVRATLYVLLPLSLIFAIVLVSQGVVQNFDANVTATTLNGETQVLPQGPAASQIAIKQIGSNGGGFFNTNSAHPYENPTPLTNFLEMFALLAVAAALTNTYDRLIGSQQQGWVIFAAMLFLMVALLGVMLWSEYATNPVLGVAGAMEGKETRFGVANSILWASATTSASNGAVNAMHSSLSPLAGGVAMLNMLLGEVIFGGVGAGLYGMLVFVILTVFIAGLMVGRTPEYLGKKIEAREIQMATVAVLLPAASILLFTALASVVEAGLSSRLSAGPHGFSEILYAYTSATANNGSAFAGLNANTAFYNITLGLALWVGRFGVIIPVMAIAGSMVGKSVAPPSPGTFPTDQPLFAGMLVAVVLIVGALTFFPALSLGPIIEQLLMSAGVGL
ncbi:potassium translocating ATPase, subunit A [Candidatus Promineifilum breve]|uniref:Potassium-transporting ATPase potassium-binding subunit n=1 Tax=Candidatus Promineifilum breve TaxID=1806508 RepID=A0A160T3M1_9CHLR|nr:potassium-transporting ATPase subunit KdpA [Candidatus Promineifilum breve]CUS04801.2 potassium translocating ATPase, subunit A [Candidatus Promineifilum breve]